MFLISLKAGGFGLTLTEADYIFLLDPWWNPAAENQAIDRAHRIGQNNNVMVYRMVSEGTIEEKVLQLQKRKAALSTPSPPAPPRPPRGLVPRMSGHFSAQEIKAIGGLRVIGELSGLDTGHIPAELKSAEMKISPCPRRVDPGYTFVH